jgi:hypothetical protein
MIIRVISGATGLLAIGFAGFLADRRFRRWELSTGESALEPPGIGLPLFFFLAGFEAIALAIMF